MPWTPITFGKYKGTAKTLPQIAFSDPDWFFWALGDGAFANKGRLSAEAAKIANSAIRIRIPGNPNKNLHAEYVFHPDNGRFVALEIVPAGQPRHEGASPTMRKSVIDLSVPRRASTYDKLGGELLLSSVKQILFGKRRLTRKIAEAFFDNPENFEN